MNKIIIFLISIILITGCSLNKNSKFWTADKKIPEEQKSNYKEIFAKEEKFSEELNASFEINLGNIINNDIKIRDHFNNDGRLNYDGLLKNPQDINLKKLKNSINLSQFYHLIKRI